MSLKDAAYQLAKALKSNPERAVLASMINGLNSVSVPGASGDRSQLGYNAKRFRLQSLGYLLMDQHRTRMPIPIPELTIDERKYFGGLHREIFELNRKCVAGFLEATGVPFAAVDPYNQYEYAMPSKMEGVSFLSEVECGKIVEEFSRHKAIEKARKLIVQKLTGIDVQGYVNDVLNFVSQIESFGVHEVPDFVRQAMFGSSEKQTQTIVQHLGAIVSIRASLMNLDQMIFQAISVDNLTTINENNVIKLIKGSSNAIGDGLSLKHLIDRETVFLEPGNLIFVKGEELGFGFKGLGCVFSTSISFSSGMGNIGEMSIRMINDDLNPYPRLVAHL